jgi:hypothetical protein
VNTDEVAKKAQNDVPSGIRAASVVPASILAAHHAINRGEAHSVSRAKQLDVAGQRVQEKKRRGPHILSTLLFLIAIGFAAVAVYLYWDETQNDKNDPTPPPAAPGEYTLAQVKTALDDQGLDTEFGRSNGHADQIPGVPGQAIKANGNDVYIYIFSGPTGDAAVQAAADAFAQIDASTINVLRQSGDEVGEQLPKHIFQGSNIVAVMVGGDDDDVQKVQAAIEGLP